MIKMNFLLTSCITKYLGSNFAANSSLQVWTATEAKPIPSANLIATSQVEQKTLYYEINAKLSEQDIISGETLVNQIKNKDDDILQSLQMPPVSVKVVQIEDPLADLKEFIVDLITSNNYYLS